MRPATDSLPVAIIGAGPIGLAAGAHLAERGVPFIVLEAGSAAGATISEWGHVDLFSPWNHLIDGASERLLATSGWATPPAKRIPNGRELVHDYLLPLAGLLAPHVRYDARVVAISRLGLDRTRTDGRAVTPFLLRLKTADATTDLHARAVIDASGSWSTPNGVTASGLGPTEETAVASLLCGPLPDVRGAIRAEFVGRHTVVVGSGHSAAQTLLALAEVARGDDATGNDDTTRITWVIRGAVPRQLFGNADQTADELEARGELGLRVQRLVTEGQITLVDRLAIRDVRRSPEGRAVVIGTRLGEELTIEADRVVVSTGFRPDLSMLRELRVALDDAVEAPRLLAPLIDPAVHSCGTVEPHGVVELSHPEPAFYLAGVKSYGRAPTFLLKTGYEQVRSIADELAGNAGAARRVQLVLPATGVCCS